MKYLNSIGVVILFGTVSALIIDMTSKEIALNKKVMDTMSRSYEIVEEMCIRDMVKGDKNSDYCTMMDEIDTKMSGGKHE